MRSIVPRLMILMTVARTRREAEDASGRWQRALREPGLTEDLIDLGGLLQLQAYDRTDGQPAVAPIDPLKLAYEAGRRDLALQLLALAKFTPETLRSKMEDDE